MPTKTRLILLVVFVATAAQMASVSAQAATTVTQRADGSGKTAHQVIDLAGASVTCATPSFNATVAGTSAAALTLTGSYGGPCTYVGQTATVSMGGCRYILHANGEVDIGGEGCGAEPITISVPSPPCLVEIGPQEGLESATFHNLNEGEGANREVTVEPHLEGIEYTAAGSGCPATGSFSNGNYTTGNSVLTAEDPGTGAMAGFWVEGGSFQVE